jgi:hypothetical protein
MVDIDASHNPLSDITNDTSVRAINAAVVSENHLEEEEEQEHDNEHDHDNTNAGDSIQFDPIKYKDETWTLPPLRKVKSTKNALEHLKTKLHYKENHAKARDQTEKNRLNNIHAILKRFLLAIFSKVQSSIKLNSMIHNDEGVYIGYYSPDRPPKFGFARNFGNRMEYQPDIQVAMKVIFPSLNCLNETVQEIIDEKCPMLQYHQEDQRDKLQKTIIFHLHELIAACVFETCTGTVGELFFSLPSSLVQDILTLPEEVSTKLDQLSSKF